MALGKVVHTIKLDFNSFSFNFIEIYLIYSTIYLHQGYPDESASKESACNAGDLGSIPGLGGSPGEGNSNPLHYYCLRNPWTEEPGGLQSIGSPRVT